MLNSPYVKFQNTTAEALVDLSDRKVSPIRFLPFIKDYLRLSLKTQDTSLAAQLLKVISNLCLDEQCRYQIINLKGI